MRSHNVRIALVIALLTQSISIAQTANVVDRCVEGVAKIRSYDVMFSLENLTYPNASDTDKTNNATNPPISCYTANKRDVLAFGLGRRVENHVGDAANHSIAIIDWQTARNRRGSVALGITYELDGNNYADFFNPNCWGFFLADLLRDKGSTVRMLERSSSATGLIGFEVTHPKMTRPIRVWADPDHGYMPSRIEKYLDIKGKLALISRTQVQEFIRIGEGVWVPVKGTHSRFAPAGPNEGMVYLRTVLVVDTQQSSWNSIDSRELFVAASLPAVNHVSRTGWKEFFPPATLAAVKHGDEVLKNAKERYLKERLSSYRFLFPAISLLLVILLIILFGWRRSFRRKIDVAA